VTAGHPVRPTAGRPLAGRVAIVTGISRRVGIGMAVARRLAALGADLFVTSWAAHDREQPWGADRGGVEAVLAELGAVGRVEHLEADFLDPGAPDRVLAVAGERFGHVDALVCNHARSGGGGLGQLTAAELDASFAVNTRAVLLLVQAFAAQRDGRPGQGGAVHLRPAPGAHAGRAGLCDLQGRAGRDHRHPGRRPGDRGITVNTVNPGPTDTDYLDQATRERVASRFPAGRWGGPDDAARLVAWPCTDDAAWITGQVINSEGGFRRFN
jgi:3-oxoacyl-[acyl-carrier protein] reductase